MSKTHKKLNFDLNKQLLNRLLLVAGMMDNIDLSKTQSGQASRYPLAFFMPRNRLTSQVSDNQSIKHLTPFTGVNRHKFMADLPAVYDWVTLQNKREPICRAVTLCTESEPNHPMIIHGVVTTQKSQGGHNRA